MLDTIVFLGIYPAAIERVATTCYDVIEGVRETLNKYNIGTCHCDLFEETKDLMSHNFDFSDMTNSIINSLFEVTTSSLNEIPCLQKLGVTFTSYTNCDDSHLFMNFPNGSTIRLCDKEDVETGFTQLISDLFDIEIKSFLFEQADGDEEKVREYPQEYIDDSIENMIFTDEDISELLFDGTLSEDVRQEVLENSIAREKIYV